MFDEELASFRGNLEKLAQPSTKVIILIEEFWFRWDVIYTEEVKADFH